MTYEYCVPLSKSHNISVESEYINNKLLPSKIKTNRLLLKPIWNYDVQSIYSLYQKQIEDNPKYIPSPEMESLNDAAKHKQKKRKQFNDNISCNYILETKNNERKIGFGGFSIDWDKQEGSYYIWLKPKYRGNEYALERAVAFTSIMFEILKLKSVKISIIIENRSSIRSAWKYIREFDGSATGLEFKSHDVTDSDCRDDTIKFTITKEQYFCSLYGTSDKFDSIDKIKDILDSIQ